MSGSSPDIAGLISQATQLISGSVLILFEYALTFSAEVSVMWNSKFTGAQALFFLTRYSMVVQSVWLCAVDLIQSPSTMLCRVMVFNQRVWFVMCQIGVYSILTLRTYAIYQKNKFILVILGLPCVANVALSFYMWVLAKPEVDTTVFVGAICTENVPSIFPRFMLASIIVSLIIDVFVFTLTFAKTVRGAIEMRKVGLGNGLGYFIMRDGAMYFLAKLLFGVVGAVVFFVPVSDAIGTWITVLSSMSNPLTVILITRLVLNLRQVSQSQNRNESTPDAIRNIREPVFATNSLLGNIGAPLRVGPEDEDIEEIGVHDEAEAEVVEERRIMNHTEIVEEAHDV